MVRCFPVGRHEEAEEVRPVSSTLRRLAAVIVALAVLALIASDVEIRTFRLWWDAHSFTGDIVSSFLLVAFTALVVDEAVARRQRRDRAFSVAAQVLIVFEQACRTYKAAIVEADGKPSSYDASEELRSLASMLLSASPSLFDDPAGRIFLFQVERFTGAVFGSIAPQGSDREKQDSRDLLTPALSDLRATAEPLLHRIPPDIRATITGSSLTFDDS
jgi:hypothetical protein